jgi:carotenoid cleavage dioxygenase
MTTTEPVRETDNPYLNGNYAPVHEEITAVDLDVTGAIPEYLDGRYLRIGPNPIGDPDPATYHWFVGTGMAHGLRLRDGKGHWYRNRWVRSADVAHKLGETWAGGPRSGGVDFAANTNIIGHAGKTLAIAEIGVRPYELTDELETVGPSDFCGTLFGGYTAHPKRDPETGELHAVSYNPLRGNVVQYMVIGVDGKVRRTVNIRLKAQTMMHDFSLTENYVVLYDLPVALELGGVLTSRFGKAVAGLLTRIAERHAAPDFMVRAVMRGSERSGPPSTGMPYRWAPERQARIGVMPRGAPRPTSGGSRFRSATCSTRSTPMTPTGASCSMSSATRRSSTAGSTSCPKGRRWTGGPSISPRGGSPTSGSMTRPRSSLALMSASSAAITGLATRWGTPTVRHVHPTRFSNTT